MAVNQFISLWGLFIKFLSDMIIFIIRSFLNYFTLFKDIFIYYKYFFLLGLFILSCIIIGFILWKNKKILSKFIWWPEPILNGPMLRVLGEFFDNYLTEGLVTLEKFLSTLNFSAGIILIIGAKDFNNTVITYYSSEYLSWFFINQNIYLYIKNLDDIKFILSFLNRIKPQQPINSLVIKNDLKSKINEDILKNIYMITNFKIPLYIVFENIKWCQYMWEFLSENDILGVLFNRNDGISEEYILKEVNKLKLSIFEKMLRHNKYYMHFWNDFDDMILQLTEIVLNTSQYYYNFFRGFFFIVSEFKIHMEEMLKIPENISYFIGFYKNIIEKEILLAEPVNNDFFVSRYDKYKNNFIYILIFIVCIVFIRSNSQLLTFKYNINYFIKDHVELVNKNNVNIKQIYKILKDMNDINLSGVNYKYFPHNYYVRNLHVQLLDMEELLLINLLKSRHSIENFINEEMDDVSIDNNNLKESYEFYKKLFNYINQILKLEKIFTSKTAIIRFGIPTISKLNNKQALIEASEDIKSIYFLLLNNFINILFKDNLSNQLINLNEKLNIFFKSNNQITINDIKEIVSIYNLLDKDIQIINIKLKFTYLYILLNKIKNSEIFGQDIYLKSENILYSNMERYFFSLMNIKNVILGNLVKIENNNNISFDDKFIQIINDIQKFLQESFMINNVNDGPKKPQNNTISNWNLFVLKDILNIQNQSSEFKEKLKFYSPQLQNIFYNIFQYKIAESINAKIGISQNFIYLDGFNITNYMEAFNILNNTLNFFLEIGAIAYYNNLIEIIYHDINMINMFVDNVLERSIFTSYKKIKNLNKDNVQELICDTNNHEKIQEILNMEIDKLIEIYNIYIKFVIDILSKEHFKKYEGTKYQSYLNLGKEINKFNKGINNSIGEFVKFIIELKDFSIYNSFQTKFEICEINNIIDEYLNKLKNEILNKSRKLYTEELILNYDNLIKELSIFKNSFPFNKKFSEHNFLNVEALYNIIHKYKKIIHVFKNNNYIPNEIKFNINKLESLLEGIKKDLNGYYIDCNVEYNIEDKMAIHNKYIGLITINQMPEYSKYFIQKNIKLYFNEPVYIHIEIAHIHEFKIPKEHPNYFTVIKNHCGITLKFNTIWHFINYIYIHEESTDNNNIISIITIPIIYGNNHSYIKVAIKINNFIFFPHHFSKLVINIE